MAAALDHHDARLNDVEAEHHKLHRIHTLAPERDHHDLDAAKIEKHIGSPEVRGTIEENFKLAEAMGMNGTPSYVIGKQVVIGAVGVENLKEKIGIARCGKATC